MANERLVLRIHVEWHLEMDHVQGAVGQDVSSAISVVTPEVFSYRWPRGNCYGCALTACRKEAEASFVPLPLTGPYRFRGRRPPSPVPL